MNGRGLDQVRHSVRGRVQGRFEPRGEWVSRTRARAGRRAVNDRCFEQAASRGDLTADEAASALPFRCECSHLECERTVWLTAGEYWEIRRLPGRFVLELGHECEDCDMVVVRSGAYVLVERPPSELFLG